MKKSILSARPARSARPAGVERIVPPSLARSLASLARSIARWIPLLQVMQPRRNSPTTSSAARNQRRPAGGRPRPPPAEPGCGVTPNQMAPGPAGTGPEKTNFAKWTETPRAPGGKHRGRWKEGTSPRGWDIHNSPVTLALRGKIPLDQSGAAPTGPDLIRRYSKSGGNRATPPWR